MSHFGAFFCLLNADNDPAAPSGSDASLKIAGIETSEEGEELKKRRRGRRWEVGGAKGRFM